MSGGRLFIWPFDLASQRGDALPSRRAAQHQCKRQREAVNLCTIIQRSGVHTGSKRRLAAQRRQDHLGGTARTCRASSARTQEGCSGVRAALSGQSRPSRSSKSAKRQFASEVGIEEQQKGCEALL